MTQTYCHWHPLHPYNQPEPPQKTDPREFVRIDLSALNPDELKKMLAWIEKNEPGLHALLNSPMRANRTGKLGTIKILKDCAPKWYI